MSDILQEEKREIDGITYVIKQVVDDCPDLSWLGEYQSKPEEYIIDRRLGFLLGAELPQPEESDFVDESIEIDCGAFDAAYDKWDEQPYEVLADVSSNKNLRTHRYFKLDCHLPHNPKNWSHVSDESLDKAWELALPKLRQFNIFTGGQTKQKVLDIFYTCEDYERMENYGRTWSMIGITVGARFGSHEVGCASLWGIASDSGDSYIEDTTKELIAECQAQFHEYLKDAETFVSAFQKFLDKRWANALASVTGS